MKYIGRNGLEAAGNVVKAVGENRGNLKDIVGSELKRVATKAVSDGGERVTKFIQTGKGTLALTHRAPKINKRPSSLKKVTPNTCSKAVGKKACKQSARTKSFSFLQ